MCDEYDAERLLEVVTEHMREHGMRFGRVGEDTMLFTIYGGDKATYPALINVHTNRPLVVLQVVVGCHAPVEKRTAVAELLTRINYSLIYGNFEMDFSDGEVRYRTSVDVAGGQLTDEMIQALICANLFTVDRFHPAIMSLLWNDLTPEEALALVEEQDDE